MSSKDGWGWGDSCCDFAPAEAYASRSIVTSSPTAALSSYLTASAKAGRFPLRRLSASFSSAVLFRSSALNRCRKRHVCHRLTAFHKGHAAWLPWEAITTCIGITTAVTYVNPEANRIRDENCR